MREIRFRSEFAVIRAVAAAVGAALRKWGAGGPDLPEEEPDLPEENCGAEVTPDTDGLTCGSVSLYPAGTGLEGKTFGIPEEYIGSCFYHEPISCYEATKKLLALPQRPSCILFPDDYAYIGGINAIHDAGLRVPEDISAAGYDGIHMARMLSPKLTTWRQNTEELGRIAAAKLIERIERPRTTPPEQIVVRGQLLEGESVSILT